MNTITRFIDCVNDFGTFQEQRIRNFNCEVVTWCIEFQDGYKLASTEMPIDIKEYYQYKTPYINTIEHYYTDCLAELEKVYNMEDKSSLSHILLKLHFIFTSKYQHIIPLLGTDEEYTRELALVRSFLIESCCDPDKDGIIHECHDGDEFSSVYEDSSDDEILFYAKEKLDGDVTKRLDDEIQNLHYSFWGELILNSIRMEKRRCIENILRWFKAKGIVMEDALESTPTDTHISYSKNILTIFNGRKEILELFLLRCKTKSGVDIVNEVNALVAYNIILEKDSHKKLHDELKMMGYDVKTIQNWNKSLEAKTKSNKDAIESIASIYGLK